MPKVGKRTEKNVQPHIAWQKCIRESREDAGALSNGTYEKHHLYDIGIYRVETEITPESLMDSVQISPSNAGLREGQLPLLRVPNCVPLSMVAVGAVSSVPIPLAKPAARTNVDTRSSCWRMEILALQNRREPRALEE